MEIFLARQPIFNRELKVEAYELLYRADGVNQSSQFSDGDNATFNVITQSLLVTDFDKLVSNKRAFINFTEHLILNEIPLIFDKDKMVIEILETVRISDDLIQAIKKLKLIGYTIALDDVVLDGATNMLAPFADIIKVDFLHSTPEERKELVKRLRVRPAKLLAEKVETRQEFKEALDLGFDLFQGYFFARPDTVVNKDIKPLSTTYLRMMRELTTEEPSYDVLSSYIETDVSMSFKLLKLINSPAFYRRAKIQSIGQALVMLGLKELRKWVMLLMLQDVSSDKPDELMRTVLIRGKLMELLSKDIQSLSKGANECFLTGMMSLIDVMTDRLIAEVLAELSLSDSITEAILDRKANLGHLLDLVEGYEQSRSEQMQSAADLLEFDTLMLPLKYFEAMEWVDELLSEEGGAH